MFPTGFLTSVFCEGQHFAKALVDCLKIELGDALTEEAPWKSQSWGQSSEVLGAEMRVAEQKCVRLAWDLWPSLAGSEGFHGLQWMMHVVVCSHCSLCSLYLPCGSLSLLNLLRPVST